MRVILISPNRLLHQHWKKSFLNSIESFSLYSYEEIDKFNFLNKDIIVLDYDNLSDILDRVIQTKVICLSSNLNSKKGFYLLKKGIKAYANNYITPQNLSEIIKTVNLDKVWVYPELMNFIIENSVLKNTVVVDNDFSEFQELSKREMDVAVEVSKGLSNKKIAERLKISERTVKAHITAIFAKTNIADRVSLALKIKEWNKIN